MKKKLFKDFKKNYLITGRGATAIYLVFCNENLRDIDVIVPANICYAAIYPIIASGNHVIFSDVDRYSGNLSLALLQKYKTDQTKAVIVPHMYGNSVVDLDNIKKWCHDNDIILIEDCASSLGGHDEKYGDLGCCGDYVVYSFGHSKIVDIGKGGFLSSDRDLRKAEEALKKLPFFNDEIRKLEDELSARYRDARYISGNYDRVKELLKDDLFLYQSDSFEEIYELINNEELINRCIGQHLNNYALYDENITDCFNRYIYNQGSVPWRFSLLLDQKNRKKIIKTLLEDKLPVSDWYPNVTDLFYDVKRPFENVDIMENELVNFPLDIERDIILKICIKINSVKGDM